MEGVFVTIRYNEQNQERKYVVRKVNSGATFYEDSINKQRERYLTFQKCLIELETLNHSYKF